MILNGKTDIGKRRKNNQDSFVIRSWEAMSITVIVFTNKDA